VRSPAGASGRGACYVQGGLGLDTYGLGLGLDTYGLGLGLDTYGLCLGLDTYGLCLGLDTYGLGLGLEGSVSKFFKTSCVRHLCTHSSKT